MFTSDYLPVWNGRKFDELLATMSRFYAAVSAQRDEADVKTARLAVRPTDESVGPQNL